MKLKQGDKEVEVNDVSNWPLIVDIFNKLGYSEKVLNYAKKVEHTHLKVNDLDKILPELSAWGIPWKRVKWDF